MRAPRVSVVMPVYNGRRYIRDALDSLVRQTFEDMEVLVVDDGSTDGTSAVVRELVHKDPRVHLCCRDHEGAVAAFNFGAERAAGEYLAWLGADDIAEPRRLELQVRLLDVRPDVAVVGANVMAVDESLRPLLLLRYPQNDRHISRGLTQSNLVAAPAATMRAAAYRAVGGCRQAFSGGAEDYDLWLRIAERHALTNLAEVLVKYRVHTGQVSRARAQQMVLSTVAAQLAARQRRSNGCDSLNASAEIGYATLLDLEPRRLVVDDAILRAGADLSLFLAMVGSTGDALRLLTWAEQMTSRSSLEKSSRAKAALVRMAVAWRARELAPLISASASAVGLDPWLALRIITKGAFGSVQLLRRRLTTMGRNELARRKRAAPPHLP